MFGRGLAQVLLLHKEGFDVVNIGISLSSESCHALAERAEENGFGDVTLRQAIEIFLDSVATEVINQSHEGGAE